MSAPAVTPLETLVAALDETALTAHASRGLFVRASRDVEAGKVTIRARATDAASIIVEEASVELSALGLKASRCSCPAVGVCRHMLAAVLALRQPPPAAGAPDTGLPDVGTPDVDPPDAGTLPPEPAGSPPAPPLAPFDLAALRALAGAQWSRAMALAATAVVVDRVGAPAVRFVETDDQVVFPPGLGLAGAVHKGKNVRRRLAVVAAALVLRHDAGEPLPYVDAKAPAGIAPETLDRVQDALAAAAALLAAGSPGKARDRLFAVAIMARTEDAPRLASQLRALARRLDTEAGDAIAERPGERMAALAEAYALAEALRAAPADPLLTGILARTYARGEPRTVALIGAEHWRTAAGARGMTLVCVDVATGRLHRAVDARGPGVDLAFVPADVYRQPLWRLASPEALMGRVIRLPEAAMAPDGTLGLNQIAERAGGPFDIRDLLGRDGAVSAWSDLGRVLRQACGLRRGVAAPMAVLFPAGAAPPDFDPRAQIWRWDWHDAGGTVLSLDVPSPIAGDPAALVRHAAGILAGLVALRPGIDGLRPCLLGLWLKDDPGRSFPLQFAFPSAPTGWRAALGTLTQLAQAAPAPVRAPDPLRRFLDRALEAVAGEAGARQAPLTAALGPQAAALGLMRIARLMTAFAAAPGPAGALRLAYAIAATRETLA